MRGYWSPPFVTYEGSLETHVPYFDDPDLFKSHMMSSPFLALVNIFALNTLEGHDWDIVAVQCWRVRTSMPPNYICANAVDLESASSPEVT